MKPTNVTLLNPNKVMWALMRETTSVDVKEGLSNNLHPDGLYSVETYGRVGTEERDNRLSFIDVKLPIFNPTYFNALVSLKSIYLGILKGTEYAQWDDIQKDFIKSNLLEGETGYSFFMKHFYQLEPKLTDSFKRKQKIELFEKYKETNMSSKVMVIPAGLRDVQIEDDRTVEMEINELYRKLIFRSKSIVVPKGEEESPIYNNVRWNIQSGFNDIDEYISSLMRGKGGIWQKRIATRGVVHSTRNVITARHVSCENADEDNGVDVNSTDIGLYQSLMAFQYLARYSLLNGWINKVFTIGNDVAKLVNPKTYSYEYKTIDGSVVDKWTSADGLTKLFNGFKNVNIRNKPIMISGCYMGLVYDDGEYVKIVGGKEELPDGFDEKHLRPMTYTDLFYMNCAPNMEEKLIQVTRYPITGVGSIYPSKFKIVTTTNSSKRKLLNDDWGTHEVLYHFPNPEKNPSYFDSMSVDSSRISLLGADFDGDAMNCIAIMTEEAITQSLALMRKRSYYINGTGKFLYDPIHEPHLFLFRSLSNGLN